MIPTIFRHKFPESIKAILIWQRPLNVPGRHMGGTGGAVYRFKLFRSPWCAFAWGLLHIESFDGMKIFKRIGH